MGESGGNRFGMQPVFVLEGGSKRDGSAMREKHVRMGLSPWGEAP